MADISKSIMDAINDATIAAGGQPCGGSIVDCLKNYYLAVNGDVPAELMGGNVSISDLTKAVTTPAVPDDSDDTEQDPSAPTV